MSLKNRIESSSSDLLRFSAVAWVLPIITSLRALRAATEQHALNHRHAYRAAHTSLHLTYLALVAAHGPYNLAAGVLFVVMAFGWALRLDAES